MPIGHPNGNAEQAFGYISLEFRRTVQTGNTHLRVISIEWYVEPRGWMRKLKKVEKIEGRREEIKKESQQVGRKIRGRWGPGKQQKKMFQGEKSNQLC